MVCIFFGHREDCSLKKDALRTAVEGLVEKGVDTFYVGHQGTFDRMVLACLGELREKYPYISYAVVWAYLPSGKTERDLPLGHTVYPEGQECVPPRFAIERRNKWLIERGSGGYCICYINHTWGGAYKFVKQTQKKGITVINLGIARL